MAGEDQGEPKEAPWGGLFRVRVDTTHAGNKSYHVEKWHYVGCDIDWEEVSSVPYDSEKRATDAATLFYLNSVKSVDYIG